MSGWRRLRADGAPLFVGVSDTTWSATPPVNPVNGQRWLLPVAAGVNWDFIYNAASASVYKWEFVGGPPWEVDIATDEAITSDNGYHDAPTIGPTITVPRAGDYQAEFSSACYATGAAAQTGFGLGVGIAGANPVVPASGGTVTGWAGAVGATGSGRVLFAGLAASTALTMKYLFASGAAGHVRWRALSVTPVRVS